MSYRLHVTAGPSLDLSTHRPVLVNNDEHPLEIETPYFRGRITVRVKEFPGHDSSTENSPHSSRYFNNKTATFSLQCQGQYGDTSQPDSLTGDDIMFGIVLREPLSDTPPLGLNLIARTMRFFWPIMESDLRSPSPWVLSPMLATMSRVHFHAPVSADHERPLEKYPHEENTNAPKQSRPELPPWPGVMADAESENIISVLASSRLLQNSSSSLLPTRSRATSVSSCALSPPPPRPSLISRLSLSPRPRTLPGPFSSDPKSRKRHFSALTARKEVRINPTDTITTDFRNSFIDFRDLSLSVPGVPFKIELGKYMVGRPTQYVCRNREGKVFWAIVFTILRY